MPQGKWLPDGFHVTPTSLTVDDSISYRRFGWGCRIISRLSNFSEECLPYHIGDLINAGERLFPNKYEQALEFTDFSIGTLRNLSWICRNVPPENRGILPIGHTREVCSLTVEDQRRILERAKTEGLTCAETRRLARGDPYYKHKAVPDVVGTRLEIALARWPQAWRDHETEWMTMNAMQRGEAIWKLACETACGPTPHGAAETQPETQQT